MKFNPTTKEIFTDNGQLIKRLDCPYKMNWDKLLPTNGNANTRLCSTCNHQIIDTSALSDTKLFELVQQNPDTCLKVDLYQNNLKIISNAIIEEK